MRKFITLLLLALTVFVAGTKAQFTATCNADFNFVVTGNNAQFIPATPGDSIFTIHTWTFGDGTPGSNLVFPAHTYTAAGVYNVKHVVRNITPNGAVTCADSAIRAVTIANTAPPCNLQANFSFVRDSINLSTFYFANLTVNLQPGDSVLWNFGDGNTSSISNPMHTYTQPGTYNVCLRVKRLVPAGVPPCVSEICKIVVAQAITQPCGITANFTWRADSLQLNRIFFTNTSTGLQLGDSIRWTFGDGTSSMDLNPVKVYQQPGTYTVCLRIKRNTPPGAAPCIREICKQVVVLATVPPCNLQANFSFVRDSNNISQFYFANLTVNIQPGDSVLWNFGDGSFSTVNNPSHTYFFPGSYTVCLRVKRPGVPGLPPCVSEICKVVVVQPIVDSCNVVANFTWVVDSTQTNRVFFSNTSTGMQPGDSIRWTFGDGTSSTAMNPTKVYQQPGTYTVCLRIKRPASSPNAIPCVREICKVVVVQPTVQPCNIVANFIWRADSTQPNRILFTNTSTGVQPGDSIRWTFGDGSSSMDMNPVKVYQQPGTYTVCLRIKRNATAAGAAPCIREICKQVIVAAPCVVSANYTWRPDTLNTRKIYFTNTSPNANSATAMWTFGDGTSATSWNATHEYAQPGTYVVCLKVQTAPNCVAYKCDTITVTNSMPPCAGLANFNVLRSPTNTQLYTFTPQNQNPAFQYTWSFGDGTGSQSMVATKLYQTPGTYTVCLTVYKNNTCVTTSCRVIQVVSQLNCNNINVSFASQRDAFMPNKVYFYAISNFPLLQQRWTITKLPATATSPGVTLYQNNPIYVFSDTGSYRVCLRAVTLGGCVKETCQIIQITQVAQQCNLAAYPNPAQSSVNVNVVLQQPQTINAFVYNAQNILVRQKVQAGVVGNNVVNINLVGLNAGFYTIKLIYGNRTCYARFQKL
jgi:PKD repeat protein